MKMDEGVKTLERRIRWKINEWIMPEWESNLQLKLLDISVYIRSDSSNKYCKQSTQHIYFGFGVSWTTESFPLCFKVTWLTKQVKLLKRSEPPPSLHKQRSWWIPPGELSTHPPQSCWENVKPSQIPAVICTPGLSQYSQRGLHCRSWQLIFLLSYKMTEIIFLAC